ncbi:elongation factor tu gtp binding domain-containing protein, partial [Cystoisospora suis]
MRSGSPLSLDVPEDDLNLYEDEEEERNLSSSSSSPLAHLLGEEEDPTKGGGRSASRRLNRRRQQPEHRSDFSDSYLESDDLTKKKRRKDPSLRSSSLRHSLHRDYEEDEDEEEKTFFSTRKASSRTKKSDKEESQENSAALHDVFQDQGEKEEEDEDEEDEELWLLREEEKLLQKIRERNSLEKKERRKEEEEEIEEEMRKAPRRGVVCVLGHVDHGKTTLLDAIKLHTLLYATRQALQTETYQKEEDRLFSSSSSSSLSIGDFRLKKEEGNITQRLSSFRVDCTSFLNPSSSSTSLTFLDTPGHSAFEKMRERGATCSDVAILVVAVDEGVKEQTERSIQICKAAHVPIVVALTKCSRLSSFSSSSPSSSSCFSSLISHPQVMRVLRQLGELGVHTEALGGDVQVGILDAKAFLDTNMKKSMRKEKKLKRKKMKKNGPEEEEEKEEEEKEEETIESGNEEEQEEEREKEEESLSSLRREEEKEEEDKKGLLEDLLQKVFLEVEMLELTTVKEREGEEDLSKKRGRRRRKMKRSSAQIGEGIVLDSFLSKGLGGCASILLHTGIIKRGDLVLAGSSFCRVKRLKPHERFGGGEKEEREKKHLLSSRCHEDEGADKEKKEREENEVGEAGETFDICGFDSKDLPLPGERILVLQKEEEGKELAELNRRRRERVEEGVRLKEAKDRLLHDLLYAPPLHHNDHTTNFSIVPTVIKTDQQGTAEALASSLSPFTSFSSSSSPLNSFVGQTNLSSSSEASQDGILPQKEREEEEEKEKESQDKMEYGENDRDRNRPLREEEEKRKNALEKDQDSGEEEEEVPKNPLLLSPPFPLGETEAGARR